MKKLAFFFLFFSLYTFGQNNTSTYYLIRHAEKNSSATNNKNPQLSTTGIKRAEKWSAIFKHVKFDLIYSTNYLRTQETATPTSIKQSVKIQLYNPSELYSREFQKATKNKTVLIVGHSNTTPNFANKILGTKKYTAMDDHNNSNLYVITIKNEDATSLLLHIPL